MFSAVQNRLESTLSHFGYGSKPSLPGEPHKSLKNQVLSTERTLQDHKIASTPPSIWKRVASLGMSYLVFSSGQSSIRETCFSVVRGYVSEPWAMPLTFVAGLSILPDMVRAQSPQATFFDVFGRANDDVSYALMTTPEGDVIVAGYTGSFGAHDVLLSKFSSNGTLLWANTLGGASNDEGWGLTATSEGDVIVAGFTTSFGAGSSDVLLSKFSSNGTLLWANTLGGANGDVGRALTTTSEGDVIVTGSTSSFGAGNADVLLSKFSSNGTLLWANTLGGTSNDYAYALTITSEGDAIVAGWTRSFGAGGWDVLLSKFSSNGTLLWANTLGGASNDFGSALTVTPEGDLIVAGYTDSFGARSEDVLLAKFSSNGTLLWANTLGEASSDEGSALTVTSEGDVIVAGSTQTVFSDVLLSKFSSNGTLLWANTLGGASNDYGNVLTVTPEGDLIVAGYTDSFGAGDLDVLLAKFNAQGSIENCSAWQSITPQVQSITPTITDVTLNMTTDIPPWTSQDATSALNVTDITSLLNHASVCYEQQAINRTFTTSPQASLSSETPLPNSQDTRESGSVSNSPSKTRSSSVKTTESFSLMPSLTSLSSHSTLMQSNGASSTAASFSSISSRNTDGITSSLIPSPSRGGTIPSITALVYEESYPIIVNGETIGTFYFTGGSGQLDSDNANTLNIQLDGDVEDGETITLFTIPEGEELLWEDIVLNNGSKSGCVTTEGVFTTSEEEYSYQLIFQHESSECYTAALKLSAISVLGNGIL